MQIEQIDRDLLDAIWEAGGCNGSMAGQNKALELIAAHRHAAPDDAVERVDDYVFQFLRGVYINPGLKGPVDSYYPEFPEAAEPPEPSWKIAEGKGWAVCLGSHKWKLTNAGKRAFGNALAARAAIAALGGSGPTPR